MVQDSNLRPASDYVTGLYRKFGLLLSNGLFSDIMPWTESIKLS